MRQYTYIAIVSLLASTITTAFEHGFTFTKDHRSLQDPVVDDAYYYYPSTPCANAMNDITFAGIYGEKWYAMMQQVDVSVYSRPVVGYNNNVTALVLFTEDCESQNGRLVLVNVMYRFSDICLETEDTIDIMNFPACVPRDCVDDEAQDVFNYGEDDCAPGVSIVSDLSPRTSVSVGSSSGSMSESSSMSLTTKAVKNKVVKKTKVSKGKNKYPYTKDKSDLLQCLIDMTDLNGNGFGLNPYDSHEFALENLMECTPDTDPDPVCMYNGNTEALALFTEGCAENFQGRVVQTKWIFSDGCDDMDFIDWVGMHDCVATSCSDTEAMSFLNSVYFDPDNTSCYADISISELGPPKTKNYSTKNKKAPKKRRA